MTALVSGTVLVSGVRVATSVGGEVEVMASDGGDVRVVLRDRNEKAVVNARLSIEHLECLRLAIGTFLQARSLQ